MFIQHLQKIFLAVVIMGSMNMASSAEAVIIFSGQGDLGSYSGTLTYSALTTNSANLQIELENTSPVGNGGYLTAFVFNNPSDAITGINLNASNTNFDLLGGPNFDNSINGAPYGQFDIGASTGGSFEGGGQPQRGIAVGESEVFLFSLTGNGLDALDEQRFFSALSTGQGAGQGYEEFVARFRGFQDGGSDKVPSTHSVPEPSTLLLMGSGMMGFFFRRQR